MKNVVVSANYFNRDASSKWLVRPQDKFPTRDMATDAVIASGVVFRPSNKTEQGFGCGTVAYCESVETTDGIITIPDGAVHLHFYGVDFYDPNDKRVFGAKELFLKSNGHMYAVEPAYKEIKAPRVREKAFA